MFLFNTFIVDILDRISKIIPRLSKTLLQYHIYTLLQYHIYMQGRIQDFQLGGGAHLNKMHRAEGGAKNFGVFRVKNHDFKNNKTN
jgi:hypothetical protein